MRKAKESFKIRGQVFDRFTIQTLIKLISSHHIDGLESVISIGKEAKVFTALKQDRKLVVKIYLLESCNFKKMYEYMRFDPRYTHIKATKRKVIFAWVQREYRNLLNAYELTVSAPKPIIFKNHVLVMEYIGNAHPAPLLKDMTPNNPKRFFNKVIENITKLYRGNLIHADLSPFNILNHHDNPVFIDFSQCTTIENPNALFYLKRDIANICNYFKKLRLKINEKKILNKILSI